MAEEIHVEALGGLAGYGERLKRVGTVAVASLPVAARARIDALFTAGGASPAPLAADAIRYRLVRTTPAGSEVVEVNEGDVPDELTRDLTISLGPTPTWPKRDE